MAGTAEPTWSKPPPTASASPNLERLGKWGRWLLKGGGPIGRAATAILDSSPTAMPWFDEVPRDDFETSLFAKARQLEAQGVDKDRIQDWFRGERMAHAATKAQSDSEAKAKAQAAGKSGTVRVTQTQIRCYKLDRHLGADAKKNKKFTKEFCRQLKEQEDAINKMTREEWEGARQHYKDNGRDGSEKEFRKTARRDAIRDYTNRGKSTGEAKRLAKENLERRAPLHVPDQVLGGNLSKILRMGNSHVNSIIGGGWPSRLAEFERHAKSLKPGEKMNVRLCAAIKGQDACSNRVS